MKRFEARLIEEALALQGIALAPDRTERLARGIQGALEPSLADPLHDTLDFDVDATTYAHALTRCKIP